MLSQRKSRRPWPEGHRPLADTDHPDHPKWCTFRERDSQAIDTLLKRRAGNGRATHCQQIRQEIRDLQCMMSSYIIRYCGQEDWEQKDGVTGRQKMYNTRVQIEELCVELEGLVA